MIGVLSGWYLQSYLLHLKFKNETVYSRWIKPGTESPLICLRFFVI